jgi:hypothetical protein
VTLEKQADPFGRISAGDGFFFFEAFLQNNLVMLGSLRVPGNHPMCRDDRLKSEKDAIFARYGVEKPTGIVLAFNGMPTDEPC